MEDKLRAHMDHLFREVPLTKKSVELKEEILQNLVDKYHDLIAEGKSEEAAYNIAVASVGDISELLDSLKEESAAPDCVLRRIYPLEKTFGNSRSYRRHAVYPLCSSCHCHRRASRE